MHQPRPSGRQAKVPTVTLSAGAGMVQTFCQESRCSTTLWGKKRKEKIVIGAFSLAPLKVNLLKFKVQNALKCHYFFGSLWSI